jgi:hypothetical protein
MILPARRCMVRRRVLPRVRGGHARYGLRKAADRLGGVVLCWGCVCVCQNTLQAVSRLLSGELTHITLNEHCLRQDGTAGYFSVEMNCLWKHNKAHCIVCFIRPAEEGMQGRQGPQGGHAVDGANGSMQAAFNMSGIPNLPNMPLAVLCTYCVLTVYIRFRRRLALSTPCCASAAPPPRACLAVCCLLACPCRASSRVRVRPVPSRRSGVWETSRTAMASPRTAHVVCTRAARLAVCVCVCVFACGVCIDASLVMGWQGIPMDPSQLGMQQHPQ